MTLKSQDDRQYRGLIWIGRLYRLAGWLGMVATVLFAVWGFVMQWQNMDRYWSGVDFWTQLTHAGLMGFFFLITGLALSAIAFGVSLGVQMGLTMMKNSQTQVELLRRLAQNQAKVDRTFRLQDQSAESADATLEVSNPYQQHRHS